MVRDWKAIVNNKYRYKKNVDFWKSSCVTFKIKNI